VDIPVPSNGGAFELAMQHHASPGDGEVHDRLSSAPHPA